MSPTLFSTKEIPEINRQIKSSATRIYDKKKSKKIKVNDTCEQVIGVIEKDISIHYASLSEWSQHDLLRHILNNTGPAKVYIATWSMSEPGATQLIKMCNNGMITEINCVLDWRIKVRCPIAHDLAKFNFAKIHLTTCHAKVTVVQNQEFNVSVVTSANYTNNPRIESGVITENKQIAEFHRQWIIDVINKTKPFE